MTVEMIGKSIVPIVLFVFSLIVIFCKKDLSGEFIKGAKDGFQTCVSLIPTLVILVCAVRILSQSCALDAMLNLASPLCKALKMPTEMLSLLIIRPFSGSGTLAMADDIFSRIGPDSFAAKASSILMGSSDTIIYTLSLYFGAVKIKKTGYAVPVSFVILIFCAILSTILARLFFT